MPHKWASDASESRLSFAGMKAKTHFAFRIDAWDTTGDKVVEQLAGLECALSGRR